MRIGIASRCARRDTGKVTLSLCIAAALLGGCGNPHGDGTVPALGAAENAKPHSITFKYTGKEQVFKVPPNVTAIKAIALGGNGAGKRGGHAGRVSAVLPVTPGEKLIVFVGGNASGEVGGFNGGANGGYGVSSKGCCDGYGGGGASDVRRSGGTRILVAGGGGGEGGIIFPRDSRGHGGTGGGVNGGSGGDGFKSVGGKGGTGGTPSAGGIGGQGAYCQSSYGLSGANGTVETGGAGAKVVSDCAGGGGGGGGYYGGGGGGGGAFYVDGSGFGAGGGGGGSFYAEPTASDVHTWAGWKSAQHGLVVLSW